MSWYKDKIQQHKVTQPLNAISDIKFLYPPFCLLIIKLFIKAYQENLQIMIFETFRTQERQLDLFNKGKSELKQNGMHHFGVATDIVFRDKKPWGDKHPWKKLGEIGKSLGLYWGGDWKRLVDSPHFQFIPVNDQNKIINDNYPSYDTKIDNWLSQLFPLYETIKNSRYSNESFQAFIQCYENVCGEKITKTEVVPENIKNKIENSVLLQDGFVAQNGTVIAIKNLNLRKGAPNTNVAGQLIIVGTLLKYTGWVNNGQNVNGNSKWFKDGDGNYFWSGNVKESAT